MWRRWIQVLPMVWLIIPLLASPQTARSDDTESLPAAMSPEESLAAIQVRPGMKVELVASEPLIEDPVAFDWGPDGRLWVAEMCDYPNGLDGKGRPGGRIKVLSDRDGDGHYDHADLFLNDVPFPNGIKVWHAGVLITAAPDIFYAEDTDGDGQADRREVLYRGFVEGNQQHRANGLRWGLDNWLHVANGDSGGTVKSLKTGEEVRISGRDLRVEPDLGYLAAESGQTQFGRDRDDWDNWFGGDNSHPLWHYVLDDRYLRRNSQVAPPDSRRQVPIEPGATPVYPISRTLTRFNDFDKADRFTSACSPIIYRDELLGPEFAGNAFLCEPVHNLVHREVVSAEGVSFVSRRAADEQQSEFFASRDSWCRPVMIRTGPDGALWLADMYRLVIEHPTWIPAEWQAKLNLRDGHDRGRIYRVYPADKPPRPLPRLDTLDTSGLVEALDSPGGWQRDMAQQMLLWKKDLSAVAPLTQLAESSARPLARLHALCTLQGLQALTAEHVVRAAADAHPGVRRHAIRLAEPFLDRNAKLTEALLPLVADPDPLVKLQLACSLGESRSPRLGQVLAGMAVEHHTDKYMLAAVLSSVREENVTAMLTHVLHSKRHEGPPIGVIEPLLGVATGFGNRSMLEEAVRSITDSASGKFELWQVAAVASVLEALARKANGADSLSQGPVREQLRGIYEQSRAVMSDPQAAIAERISAMRLMGHGLADRDAELAALGTLLAPQHPREVQSGAVAAIGRFSTAGAAQQLLSDWGSRTPDLRAQILDNLFTRNEWTEELLAAVERGLVLPAHVDARRRQQLARNTNESIRNRAEKLLSVATDSNRERVLRDFQTALELEGRVEPGRVAFGKHCAKCHRLEDAGAAVGPDLTALSDRSPAALFVAILDPNRAVEDKFLDYIVVTEEGRQATGMLGSETGTAITLIGPDGKLQPILRSQIEQLVATGKSLMPEGVEKDVTPRDVADIIAYVRSVAPRAHKKFPGNEPRVASVRDDGSIRLLAIESRIYGPTVVLEETYRNLGKWQSEEDRVVWSIQVPKAGQYHVRMDYACDDTAAGNRYRVIVAGQTLGGTVRGTGGWDAYRGQTIGTVDLPAGPAEVLFRSDGRIEGFLIDLREIVLDPDD